MREPDRYFNCLACYITVKYLCKVLGLATFYLSIFCILVFVVRMYFQAKVFSFFRATDPLNLLNQGVIVQEWMRMLERIEMKVHGKHNIDKSCTDECVIKMHILERVISFSNLSLSTTCFITDTKENNCLDKDKHCSQNKIFQKYKP